MNSENMLVMIYINGMEEEFSYLLLMNTKNEEHSKKMKV